MAHFDRAVNLDPTFDAPMLMAAVAHLNLGEYAQADSITNELNHSRDRLSATEAYWVDWLLAILAGDRLAALRASSRMGLPYQHGNDARRANRPQETIDVYADLDPDWCGYEGCFYFGPLTAAHHVLGDYRHELEEARRARELYPDQRTPLDYAARALAALGRTDEIAELLEQGLNLPPQSGGTAGVSMLFAALELQAHGHQQASREIAQRAEDWFESRPELESDQVRNRYGLARARLLIGRWDDARELLEGLVAEVPSGVTYRGLLGFVNARLGARDDARRLSDELAAMDRPYLFGSHTYWRAGIAATLGDHEEAMTLLRDAIGQGRSYGLWSHRELMFESLRDYPPFQELIRPKG